VKIIKYFELCKRLETVEEKSTQYCASDDAVVDFESIFQSVLLEPTGVYLCPENVLGDYLTKVEYRFEKKIAKVKVDMEALQLHRSDLEAENAMLRSRIALLFTDLSVSGVKLL
jgi:hypothetical protein